MFHIEEILKQGMQLHEQGNFREAKICYEKILQLQADHFDTLQIYGTLLGQTKNYIEAIKVLTKAIEINPFHSTSFNNRGNALKEIRNFEDAITNYDEAIKLQSNYSEAYNNRGLTLAELNRPNEAIIDLILAIKINPNNAEAYNNLGVSLMTLGFLELALINFNMAISINKHYGNAYWNKSLCYLLNGDFKNGFREYEWRWESKLLQGYKRHYQKPLWLGEESLSDKIIFIYSEQGLGDIIQFCRYIEMVSDLGARVVLEIPSSLNELISSLKGVSQIIISGEDIPYYDFQCPIMSLPLAFKTDIKSIPARIPYLSCPKEKKLYWQKRLGGKSKLRVGLAWSGGFRPNQPEFWTINSRRNIPLEKLASLKHSEVQFYSLQKGDPAESELHKLLENGWDGLNILDYTNELTDFTDTSAMIESLDLIISVDTSVAHLAGALGKPVWLLNRYDTCWRWLLNRNDSPWYPSLKIYRQEKYGDWDNVIQRVKLDLINAISINIY